VLPVRIYGMDAAGKPFNSVAHTLNVSKSGALLSNVEIALAIGDVIGVQKGVYKSKFRVKWIGRKGSSSQGQIGIECTEGPKNIWGVDERPLSASREAIGAQRRTFSGGGFDAERRIAPRHGCDLGVQIRQPGSEVNLWSRCTDLSDGGCYIDSRSPLTRGAKFQLTLFSEPEHLTIPSIVRTSFPGMGMGIQFLFESEDQAVKLRRFVRQKFGGEEEAPKAVLVEYPALEKLSECVEQLRAWAGATELDEADREEMEDLAVSLRRELQGLRAELNERAMARKTKLLAHSTSA
jgi:hypothetical protein